MTPADRLRAALASLHWSQRGFAAILRRDERQVRRWLDCSYEPPSEVLIWAETLAEFHNAHPVPMAS